MEKIVQLVDFVKEGNLNGVDDAMFWLIGNKIDLNDIICENENSLLHLAVIKGHAEIVKILAEYGNLDLNAVNRDGDTPIQLILNKREKLNSNDINIAYILMNNINLQENIDQQTKRDIYFSIQDRIENDKDRGRCESRRGFASQKIIKEKEKKIIIPNTPNVNNHTNMTPEDGRIARRQNSMQNLAGSLSSCNLSFNEVEKNKSMSKTVVMPEFPNMNPNKARIRPNTTSYIDRLNNQGSVFSYSVSGNH